MARKLERTESGEEECEGLWAEEAEARYRDFKAGNTTAVDGDGVFARARARSCRLSLRQPTTDN
jgi:hypothetical protein